MAEKSVFNRSATVDFYSIGVLHASYRERTKRSPTSRYERKHAIGAQQNSRHDVHHRALCVDTIMYCTCTNKHKQSCTVSVSRSNECRSNYQFSGPDSNRNVIHWQHTHTHAVSPVTCRRRHVWQVPHNRVSFNSTRRRPGLPHTNHARPRPHCHPQRPTLCPLTLLRSTLSRPVATTDSVLIHGSR